MADNILMTIKKIIKETVESMVLSDNIVGTVISTNPLKIRINEKMVLEEVHFYKLKSAIGDYPVSGPNITGTCHHRLKVGSRVLLNRCYGGEKYVVLGELID